MLTRSLAFRLLVCLGLIGLALTTTGCPDDYEGCTLGCN
jgi:hypothetical protein